MTRVDDTGPTNTPHSSGPPVRDSARPRVPGEAWVIWVIWMTYGAFYFGRTNIAAAVPGMGDELGFSKTQIGWILASLKLTYAMGQFVNGQLAERISPRKLLAVGMLGSAALNVLFGMSTALYFLLFVWACNGYCQALGWTPCVRVTANWIPPHRRGKAIGIIGTGYQATAALTFVVAGFSVERLGLGWRGAFYIPAAMLTVAAVHMLLFLREAPAPQTSESRANAADPPATPTGPRGTLRDNLVLTLSNPSLWLLGISLGLLNACRYGFLDWGLTHLTEVQDTGVGKAALKYAFLPIGGIAGAYFAGWATDRFLGGRRAPMIVGLLVLLGLLTLVYDAMARASYIGTILLLIVIGATIYGPQVLLVGTAPADLARRGTAAAAAGFVNFMGYIGAFAGDLVTGYIAEHYGWGTALRVWAGWAFAGAAAAALLWNATAQTDTADTPHGFPVASSKGGTTP